jgi:hypothetical protein
MKETRDLSVYNVVVFTMYNVDSYLDYSNGIGVNLL